MSKFRHPITNRRYTSQLFWDMQIDQPIASRIIEPMFTLHEDKPGLINFRKEYVRDMDPTGHKTANRLLESYEHYNMLMKLKWFKDAKKEWDKELGAKMEQEATDVLMEIMKGGEDFKTTERISAAKVILGKAKVVNKEPLQQKGRPSKAQIEGELKEQARLTKEEQEDLKRIRSIK